VPVTARRHLPLLSAAAAKGREIKKEEGEISFGGIIRCERGREERRGGKMQLSFLLECTNVGKRGKGRKKNHRKEKEEEKGRPMSTLMAGLSTRTPRCRDKGWERRRNRILPQYVLVGGEKGDCKAFLLTFSEGKKERKV